MKYQLIRFRNGKYGVKIKKLLPFGEERFLDINKPCQSWPMEYVSSYCQGTEEQAEQAMNSMIYEPVRRGK